MNLNTITKIGVIVIGLLSAVFFFMVFFAGDEQLKADALSGNFGTISPMISLALITFYLTIFITLVFAIIGLFSNKKSLKGALIGVGALAVVLFISYSMASSDYPSRYDELVTGSGARWIETGIYMFYILGIIAIALMILSNLKKIIK